MKIYIKMHYNLKYLKYVLQNEENINYGLNLSQSWKFEDGFQFRKSIIFVGIIVNIPNENKAKMILKFKEKLFKYTIKYKIQSNYYDLYTVGTYYKLGIVLSTSA
jgi:hypothetical protein